MMATAVSKLAERTPGKESVAIESYARALRQASRLRLTFAIRRHCFSVQLPTIIADNAGYDSAELVANLRAAHVLGKSTFGLGRDLRAMAAL